ncbi:hypothetical protein ABW19_dt0203526 [Dactylella cylindrospora]|nr:hypothetical protein ABW19_dt0203526 [Dactylella cylindrospora]
MTQPDSSRESGRASTSSHMQISSYPLSSVVFILFYFYHEELGSSHCACALLFTLCGTCATLLMDVHPACLLSPPFSAEPSFLPLLVYGRDKVTRLQLPSPQAEPPTNLLGFSQKLVLNP